MKLYDYTYKVIYINLTEYCITVKYTPVDERLTAQVLRIPLIKDENDQFKDITEVIKNAPPHNLWEIQEYLIDNYNELLNKTELVIIENA